MHGTKELQLLITERSTNRIFHLFRTRLINSRCYLGVTFLDVQQNVAWSEWVGSLHNTRHTQHSCSPWWGTSLPPAQLQHTHLSFTYCAATNLDHSSCWGWILFRLGFGDYPDSKVHGANMGLHGSNRPQMGPMLAPWTLLSGVALPNSLSHYHMSVMWSNNNKFLHKQVSDT